MLKKNLAFLLCSFLLLSGSLAIAQGNTATISDAKKIVYTAETPKGESKITISYPIITTDNNSMAGQKMSYYFSNDAEKALHWFRNGHDKNTPRTEGIRYEVAVNDENYISFLEHFYIYYKGAAHPMSSLHGITFDAQTGKQLQWKNIIRPEDASAFTLESINTKLFDSKYGQEHYFYPNFNGLKKLPTNYYLDTQHNIHFLFGQYEIGPYSAGIIDLNMEKQAK